MYHQQIKGVTWQGLGGVSSVKIVTSLTYGQKY